LHFFCDETIISCIEQKTYNSKLQTEFPSLNIKCYQPFVISKDKDIYLEMTSKLNIEPRGVPITIIENKAWEGFIPQFYTQMQNEINNLMNITKSLKKNNPDIKNLEDNKDNKSDYNTNKIKTDILKIPLIAFFIILLVALLILVTSLVYTQLIPLINTKSNKELKRNKDVKATKKITKNKKESKPTNKKTKKTKSNK